MNRPHHVGSEGLDRLGIRLPHQRLCRQMKDDLRLVGRQRRLNALGIANVAANIHHRFAHAGRREETRLGRRRQCEADHFRSRLLEPK